MDRVTPEMVKEAYEATGFVPVRYSMDSGKGRGCGVCALEAVAVHFGRGRNGYPIGLGLCYCTGFFMAWDGDDDTLVEHSRQIRTGESLAAYDRGRVDGIAAQDIMSFHPGEPFR